MLEEKQQSVKSRFLLSATTSRKDLISQFVSRNQNNATQLLPRDAKMFYASESQIVNSGAHQMYSIGKERRFFNFNPNQ